MEHTQQLVNEHDGILLMLQIMDRVCDRIEKNEPVDPRHLEQIVEFLMVFADQCHHAKEEEVLFPALVESGLPEQGGPISVLKREHNAARSFIQGLGEGVTEYQSDGKSARAKIIRNARSYRTLMMQHINKENTILFPLADAYIGKERQDAICQEYERIEAERIGLGKHEQFRELLKKLKGMYLE